MCVAAVLMSWLSINEEVASRALSGGLRVQDTEIPDSTDAITCAVLDEHVDIHLVRPYCTPPAWTALSALVRSKADGYIWMCGICNHNLSEELSIVCEACFVWYHMRCCGLKKCPKSRSWFCHYCQMTDRM